MGIQNLTMERKYTFDKYKELGLTVLSDGGVKDKHGTIFYPRKSQSPSKAIRLFCLECMGLSRKNANAPRSFEDVDQCNSPMCPVYDFRFGTNPFHTRSATD